MNNKKIIAVAGSMAIFFVLQSQQVARVFNAPEQITVYKDELRQEINYGHDTPVFSDGERIYYSSDGIGHAQITYELLGIPVKKTKVTVLPETKVTPGGHCVGVAIFCDGILISGYSDISCEGGNRCPAIEAGLKAGDIITSVNGRENVDVKELGKLAARAEKPLLINYSRNGKGYSTALMPVYDIYEKQYRLGLWLRESIAGIGTVTYIDGYRFGALGHSVCDADSGVTVPVRRGEIVECVINDVEMGVKGKPGELKGSFRANAPSLGIIEDNNQFGLYGIMTGDLKNEIYPEGVPKASRYSVKTGEATILTSIDNSGIKEYDVKIVKINRQEAAGIKGMVIEVTDKELLKKTGGIVQGMSGSPILQDGKIIGAVTHVLINNPTRGYGLFMDWMNPS